MVSSAQMYALPPAAISPSPSPARGDRVSCTCSRLAAAAGHVCAAAQMEIEPPGFQALKDQLDKEDAVRNDLSHERLKQLRAQ